MQRNIIRDNMLPFKDNCSKHIYAKNQWIYLFIINHIFFSQLGKKEIYVQIDVYKTMFEVHL